MFRLFKVIKELILYRDYLKIIDKESKNSPTWVKRKLRKDWLGRMYTVINLPPEVIFAVDLPKESRPSFVVNEIRPINEYFKSLNLEEILTLYTKPVEGTNEESYLVVYQFVFRELSVLWIIRFLAEITILSIVIYKWGYLLHNLI